MPVFCNGIDRSNTVSTPDGCPVWVAPSSLARHGLKNRQKLTVEEWRRLGIPLAREWITYVEQPQESGSSGSSGSVRDATRQHSES